MFQNLQFIDNKDIKRCIHLKVIIYSHKTLLEYSINVSKLSKSLVRHTKKNGESRMLIDFRKLNSNTNKENRKEL